MRTNRTGHVKIVVDGLLKKLEGTRGKKGTAVKDAWEQAAGEDVRKRTRPVSLKKGVLTVIVEDTAWLYRLTLEKRNILSKFNENYRGRNKLSDIRFRIGSLDDWT